MNIKCKNKYLILKYFIYRQTFSLTLFAAVCMWIMWVSAYMHQMNPLIAPELDLE